MEVLRTSQEDGRNCAHLIDLLALTSKLLDALQLAGASVTGPGVLHREQSKAWLVNLAQKMGKDLGNQEQMRVKSISAPQALTTKLQAPVTRNKKKK